MGNGDAELPRFDEYKAILENLQQLAGRRQSGNNIFVALNTTFLTATGVFLSTQPMFWKTWTTTAAVGVITLVVTPINILWLVALHRYLRGNKVRYDLLKEIEKPWPAPGLYRSMNDTSNPDFNIQPEIWLARYFTGLFPLVCIIIALITLMI
jgi:hypothetical protein